MRDRDASELDPDLGLAAAAGVVLAAMAVVILVAVTIAEPDRGEEQSAGTSDTPMAWIEPPRR